MKKDKKVLEDYIERIRRTAWLEPILRPHLSTWQATFLSGEPPDGAEQKLHAVQQFLKHGN